MGWIEEWRVVGWRLVMSKGVPVGVQSSTPTLTHEKPYPSEG